MERRLAAILAADVVGYSRLMRNDEAGTLAALKRCESELIEPVVAHNNGRIVKRMGDGFLVEFGSAVDAVECALAWQDASNSAKDASIRFRIGVNLGDIIFQDDDIYGDGVNVAARLEGLADTGGICIASVVHDQVRRKVEATFTDLGDQALKNIDEPVRVFSWSRDEGATESAEKVPAPTAPEPSMLLVVPFRALGADPTAETLSEALTENIAEAMSHFDEMSILDPGAVPADADVKSGRELGQRLGVLFLLEGRVQAAGDKVRVSAQIIEVETGQRKWSDSFDREVGDVFALQDDLTAIVASTVGEALISLVSEALDRKPESEWTARDFVMRGTTHLHRVDREQTLLAREYYEKALARDPQSPFAIICDCWTYAFEVMFGWPKSREDGVDYSIARIRELLTRSDRHSQAHRLMSRLLHIKGEHSAALNYSERALELNPYDSDMLIAHGHSLLCTGQGMRAVELAERAVRINPYAPEFYGLTLAQAYILVGRFEDALGVLDKLSRPVGASQHARVMCLAMLDRLEEARQGFEAIAAERPGLSVEFFRKTLPFTDGPEVDEILAALWRAGVPGETDGPAPVQTPIDEDKPSIAVLAFDNVSGAQDQDYLSDGIAEDIISGLSRIRSLFVVARNSSFTFKGQAVDVREVGVSLGVRYVLDGSVRHSGNRIRVTAQLIEADSGSQLWAERFDRELEDIFAVQDEITEAILGALLPEINAAEVERAKGVRPDDLDAWALFHRGHYHMFRYSKDDNREARALFKRAIEIDPGFASAHAGLAYASFLAVHDDYTDDAQARLDEGLKAGRMAVKLDAQDAIAHAALGRILTMRREYDDAVAECDWAIELNPSFGPAYFARGYAFTLSGRGEEATPDFERAVSLSPHHPNLWAFLCIHAWARTQYGDHETARDLALQAARHPNTNFWAPATLALACANLGRVEEAKEALDRALSEKPDLSMAYIGETLPFKDDAVRDSVFGVLCEIGLVQSDQSAAKSDQPAAPDKPSIAVLTFDNMSGDPEQEYFSDGLTEDIITELSRFSELFVIARNSSFAFKGQSVDVKQVAAELSVRYILEGSVRRAADRVRITAQLLDSETGSHIWAEKYDRELADIFELQEEITRNVVGSIAPRIEVAELERGRRLGGANLSAYELSLQAQALVYDGLRAGDFDTTERAIATADAALDLDERNTHALWAKAMAYTYQHLYRWGSDPDNALTLAGEIADRLVHIDASNPKAYTARAWVQQFRGNHDAAIADYHRSNDLNPNFAVNLFTMAWGEAVAGLTSEAKEHAHLALRLSPRDMDMWLGEGYLALAQAEFADGNFAEALRWAKPAIQMDANAPIRRALYIASCGHSGDNKSIALHIDTLNSVTPNFVADVLSGKMVLFKQPEHNQLLVEGLRKAGIEDIAT